MDWVHSYDRGGCWVPGIEDLELYGTEVGLSVGVWSDVWEVSTAPGVLPALRRVQIVAINYASSQHAIIGELPTRRIVRLPNSDTTSSPEAVSAEKVLVISRRLLGFLQV